MFKVARTLLSQQGQYSPQRQEYAGLAVTPADGTDLPGGTTVGLMCTVGGNVNVQLPAYNGGAAPTAVLTALIAGVVYDVAVSRVLATSTTATGIVACYNS